MTDRTLIMARVGLRLNDAREELILARRGKENLKDYHFANMRDAIAALLLCGENIPDGEAEEWLVDAIATAITDSTDIDCTSESQARYIVDELFKHLKPEDV